MPHPTKAPDPYGDTCDAYERNPSWCGGYDDSDFTSNEMCCTCGGGSSGQLIGGELIPICVGICPGAYYDDKNDHLCKACPERTTTCVEGTTLETILLRDGHWRAHATTPIDYIRKCPRPENCIGNVPFKGCLEGTTGPLCATCASGFVETSAHECKVCDGKTKTTFRVALFLCVGVCTVVWFYRRKLLHLLNEEEAFATFLDRVDRRLEKFRDAAKINVLLYQILTAQVMGCITCPWPSAYYRLCKGLGILGLNFLPYLTSICDFPRLNFYAMLFFMTIGPIVVVLAIYVYYHTKVKSTITALDEEQARLRSMCISTALVFLYVVFPGSSLVVFQTFACVSILLVLSLRE